MNFNINPMREEDVDIIVKWKYPLPYLVYNIEATLDTYDEFLGGEYFSVYVSPNELIGYYCFGMAAQVPCENSLEYYKDVSFLDIGLGMGPKMCGKGKGRNFVEGLLEFAKKHFGKIKFRLTVAAFNLRAIKVYEYHGFKETGKFSNEVRDFLVMTCEKGL